MAAALQRVDELALLLRGHTAKDVIAIDRGVHLTGRIERGCVHIPIGPRDADRARDRRDRTRVVTGDDIEGNALLTEIADGVRRGRTNLIADGHKAQGTGLTDDIALIGESVDLGNHQHAAQRRELGDAALETGKDIRREHELRGAHDARDRIRAERTARELRAAPLLGG